MSDISLTVARPTRSAPRFLDLEAHADESDGDDDGADYGDYSDSGLDDTELMQGTLRWTGNCSHWLMFL